MPECPSKDNEPVRRWMKVVMDRSSSENGLIESNMVWWTEGGKIRGDADSPKVPYLASS